MFCQNVQNRAVLKSRSEKVIISLEDSENNAMFGGCVCIGRVFGRILRVVFLLVVFLYNTHYYLLDVDRNHMLDLVDLWLIKCNFFTLLGRLDLSKAPFFRLMTILHIDSYSQQSHKYLKYLWSAGLTGVNDLLLV